MTVKKNQLLRQAKKQKEVIPIIVQITEKEIGKILLGEELKIRINTDHKIYDIRVGYQNLRSTTRKGHNAKNNKSKC